MVTSDKEAPEHHRPRSRQGFKGYRRVWLILPVGIVTSFLVVWWLKNIVLRVLGLVGRFLLEAIGHAARLFSG